MAKLVKFEPMYRSKNKISTKNKVLLEKELTIFLEKNKCIYCKALKRKVYLDKLPMAITGRKKSVTRRLKRFFVAIDILKNEKKCTFREQGKNLEYEIVGLDYNSNKVVIHLREELNTAKNRILFFVSCY